MLWYRLYHYCVKAFLHNAHTNITVVFSTLCFLKTSVKKGRRSWHDLRLWSLHVCLCVCVHLWARMPAKSRSSSSALHNQPLSPNSQGFVQNLREHSFWPCKNNAGIAWMIGLHAEFIQILSSLTSRSHCLKKAMVALQGPLWIMLTNSRITSFHDPINTFISCSIMKYVLLRSGLQVAIHIEFNTNH